MIFIYLLFIILLKSRLLLMFLYLGFGPNIITAIKIKNNIEKTLMSYDTSNFVNTSSVNCSALIPSKILIKMESYAASNPQGQFSIPTSYLFTCLNAITYEKSVPAFVFSNATIISFTITASEIIAMDSQNNLIFKALVEMEWYDPRLKWSLDFPVPQWVWPTSVVRDVSAIWYPVFEVLKCPLADCTILPPNNSHVYQRYDGYIKLTMFYLVNSKCPLDYTYFPFDHQTCNFTIALLDFDLYHESSADLYSLIIGSISAFFEEQSPEWNLIYYNIQLTDLEYSALNGTTQRTSSVVNVVLSNKSVFVTMTLSRVGSYFLYNLIVPLYVIVALGIAAIFMPASESEKPGLLLEVLIAFTLYQLLLANNSPQTSSVPLIG